MTWQYQSRYDVTKRAVTSTVTQERNQKATKIKIRTMRDVEQLAWYVSSEYVRAQPIVKER